MQYNQMSFEDAGAGALMGSFDPPGLLQTAHTA